VPYGFEGREAVRLIVRRIDRVLGEVSTADFTNKHGLKNSPSVPIREIRGPIPDARCAVAGGAQWGKTILELNFAAYATAQRFLRFGLFLPDDALAAGMVDTKLRPDVIDQIPWLARMTQVGKAVNKSGKTVNRKGAFMVTDGHRRSYGLVLGLQKIPTSYTLDIAAKDEVDDIPDKTGRFVRGRLTSSPLRFSLDIGTQRVAGRGMNKVWKDGSQGVVLLGSGIANLPIGVRPGDEVVNIPPAWINPEEHFPQIIRRQLGASPSHEDPKLTSTGQFKRDGDDTSSWRYERTATYYLAHPETGAPLNRRFPLGYHRVPEKLASENWTLRISQLSIDAISVAQIVHGFCDEEVGAIASPQAMIVFRCDITLPVLMRVSITVVARARRSLESCSSNSFALSTGRAFSRASITWSMVTSSSSLNPAMSLSRVGTVGCAGDSSPSEAFARDAGRTGIFGSLVNPALLTRIGR